MSGVVTDENGSPVANAQVTLDYTHALQPVRTSIDAHGYYTLVFGTWADSYRQNSGVVGVIFYTGGGEFEEYVQAVPWGTADIVKNPHLRRVRTVNAGQSLAISIDSDSSIAHDGEDYAGVDWLWEKVHVRVADAGILTIGARTQAGGIAPALAVFCNYDTDNCRFDWVKVPMGSGTASLSVQANSLFEIRLSIPSPMAPQRYEIETSLER